jgi:hypothetical protein
MTLSRGLEVDYEFGVDLMSVVNNELAVHLRPTGCND